MVLSWQVSSNTSPRVISMYIDIDTYVRLSVNPPACLPERATKRKKKVKQLEDRKMEGARPSMEYTVRSLMKR